VKFGKIKIDDAVGAILAHTLRSGELVIKKGSVLTSAHLKEIKAAGIDSVTAASLETGDMGEDDVAHAIATKLAGNGVGITDATSGRCNLYAKTSGILNLDIATINELNASGGGVLCSTIPSFAVAEAGQTIATVKVIPYAVAGGIFDALLKTVSSVGSSAINVQSFKNKRTGLVLSEVAGTKQSILDKALEVISARVETLGSEVLHNVCVAHEREPLADAVRVAAEICDVVLVLGGASTVDIGDTVPAAIIDAGGKVDLFGIPVDPGNLLVSGTIGNVVVLGLPGCARSPKMNGVDLILPRLFAGMDISPETLLGLGVGGLLHDVSDRPAPRESHHTARASNKGANVAAVVLAAGSSRRMGAENKLLKEIDGQAMVCRVVEAAKKSSAGMVIVVTGHQAAEIRSALKGMDVTFVHNAHFEEGLSTSVRAGIGHVPGDCSGALMVLGDMPSVSSDIMNTLIDTFNSHDATAICVPSNNGKRGNPMVWPREFFPDMLDLAGDTGARKLAERYNERVVEVDVKTEGIFLDVDTLDDLDAI